jgi:hypothetical protein
MFDIALAMIISSWIIGNYMLEIAKLKYPKEKN